MGLGIFALNPIGISGALLALGNQRRGDWSGKTLAGAVSAALPVGFASAALLVAFATLAARADTLGGFGAATTTPEWATLAGISALVSVVALFEALRLGFRDVAYGASMGLLLALELVIATAQPDSIQTYSAPAGLYLMGFALSLRTREELFGRHMLLSEGVLILGQAVLILPGMAEALESGMLVFSVLLLGEAIALVFGGLLFGQRWLVVGGVTSLTAVAIHLVGGNVHRPPQWVTLALAGLGLLAGGIVILGARDWWDRMVANLSGWWFGGAEIMVAAEEATIDE